MGSVLPRPLVGVTQKEPVAGEPIAAYHRRLRAAGARTVRFHGADENALALVLRLDGLVLTGGADVDPALYGETPHPETSCDRARDEFELALLHCALERDIPVLAICRGHQLLNVAFGGSLLQHIEAGDHRAHRAELDHASRWHPVDLAPDSRLHEICGVPRLETNSRHHQAVTPEWLGKGLAACGWSPDGLVEALESTEHRWVVGVQWHPERAEPERPGFAGESAGLFRAFLQAVTGDGRA